MAAKAGWQGFSQSHFSKRTARNVNALILWVLRESILEQKKDLAFHADKVRFYNEQKKALRNHMARLRAKAAKLRGGGVRVRSILLRRRFEKGKNALIRRSWKTMTKAHMEATIEDMRRQLSSVGNDAQLANIEPSEHAPEIAADLADDFERVQDASRGNHLDRPWVIGHSGEGIRPHAASAT